MRMRRNKSYVAAVSRRQLQKNGREVRKKKRKEKGLEPAQLGDMASSRERRFQGGRFVLSDPHASPTKRSLYKFYYVYLPLLWESVVVCSAIVSVFLVSYQAIYHAGLLWQWVLAYAMDVVYTAYIVYRFLRPFKKRGEPVTNKKKIALNYIRTSFIPDLLSVLPIEVFSFAGSNPIYIAGFLRLNRFIRCYKVFGFLCKFAFVILSKCM